MVARHVSLATFLQGGQDICAFIDQAPPAMTYSELEAAIADRFGRDRRWTRDRIASYCILAREERRRKQSRIERDAELQAFIDDRVERVSLDRLVSACRQRFGKARAPS